MPARTDLFGKVAIVTGATAGIGREIARGLAMMRAKVILPARSAERGEAARADIVEDTCNDDVHVRLVDTSLSKSVVAFAESFRKEHDRLDLLVNNAGVWSDVRTETKEGVETTFATNVLGYFTMTNELRPLLEATPGAHVVNVASKMAKGLDVTDLEFRRRSYSGTAAYAQSKQANRMLTWALDRRLGDAKVYCNAVHPGVVASELGRDIGGVFGGVSRAFFSVFGKSTRDGADTPLWVATHDDCSLSRGNFYAKRKIIPCSFRDDAKEDALWDACEALVKKALAAP